MTTSEAILSVPVFSTLCNEAFRLRRAVFVEEQAIPEAEEFDADDLAALHLVLIAEGEVRATLRIIKAAEHVQIGRVAVSAGYRGRGIAARLMQAAIDRMRPDCAGRFYLSAQADKIGFYRRFGFAEYGEPYLDGGIVHYAMKTY